MRDEDYVSVEVAKLLKKKGYSDPCCTAYDKEGNVGDFPRGINWNESYDWVISRPTLYLATKWLREQHQLHVSVGMIGDYATDADGNKVKEWTAWTFSSYYTTSLHHVFDCFGRYDTYEEALNDGILETLIWLDNETTDL